MRKIVFIPILILMFSICGVAQRSADETEILRIHKGLDEALLKGNIVAFEKVFAFDYVYSNNFGIAFSRSENLAYLKELFADKDFKIRANFSENIKIRVKGGSALVTCDWQTTSLQINDPQAEPHNDTGRYTGYYEKRDGKWLLVVEHNSERKHDTKMMERQLAVLGRKYSEMIKHNDETAIRQLLADDYLLSDEEGKVFTKEQDLATYKDRATTVDIEKIEYLDQKIQVISNNSAIDHSTIRFVGTRSGKAFDITERCTTIWAFNNGRWQIVADHFSYVKP
ncbi:MAG: nuclear transport factor 2 family protein [Pyrinomonadaceae bacterium]